jgi:hypothetical protein
MNIHSWTGNERLSKEIGLGLGTCYDKKKAMLGT